MASRVQEGGAGIGSSGSFRAKVKAKASKAIVSTVMGKKAGAATAATSSRNSVKAAEAKAAVKAAKSKPPLATGTGSVRVVKPTSDAARATKNTAEAMRVSGAKSGATSSLHSSITSAGRNADKLMGKKTSTIKIKSK